MFTERTSVGLDVHARSVVAAALDTTAGVIRTARLTPSPSEVLAWVRGLPGPAAVRYEAGPTDYGLARAFTARECDVWSRHRPRSSCRRGIGLRPMPRTRR